MADNKFNRIETGWPNPSASMQSPEETIAWAKEMKTAAERAGIEIWTVHIRYGGIYDISKTDEIERQKAVAINAADMENASRFLGPFIFEDSRGNPPIISIEDLAWCWNKLKEEAEK